MEFIAVDLETTGTLPYVDRIVEIAAVHFKDGKVEKVFHNLVQPGVSISEEVSKINGITNEMVQGKPEIENVLEPFADFCAHLPMVAHNASFDFQFLNSAIKKHKTKAPLGTMIDTYALARRALPGMRNYRLSTLVQSLKIEYSHFHRAEQDAKYCGLLFIHLIQKLQTTSVSRLVQLSGKAGLKFPQIKNYYKQLHLSI